MFLASLIITFLLRLTNDVYVLFSRSPAATTISHPNNPFFFFCTQPKYKRSRADLKIVLANPRSLLAASSIREFRPRSTHSGIHITFGGSVSLQGSGSRPYTYITHTPPTKLATARDPTNSGRGTDSATYIHSARPRLCMCVLPRPDIPGRLFRIFSLPLLSIALHCLYAILARSYLSR